MVEPTVGGGYKITDSVPNKFILGASSTKMRKRAFVKMTEGAFNNFADKECKFFGHLAVFYFALSPLLFVFAVFGSLESRGMIEFFTPLIAVCIVGLFSCKIVSSIELSKYLVEKNESYNNLTVDGIAFDLMVEKFENYKEKQKSYGLKLRFFSFVWLLFMLHHAMLAITSGDFLNYSIIGINESAYYKVLFYTSLTYLSSFIALVFIPYAIKQKYNYGCYVEKYDEAKVKDLR